MAGELREIGPSELHGFLRKRPYSVIHLDADWDNIRLILQSQINPLVEKHPDTSFGYIDIQEHQDHAISLGIRTVPSCSYYRGTGLVATIASAGQDVDSCLKVLKNGGTPELIRSLQGRHSTSDD